MRLKYMLITSTTNRERISDLNRKGNNQTHHELQRTIPNSFEAELIQQIPIS